MIIGVAAGAAGLHAALEFGIRERSLEYERAVAVAAERELVGRHDAFFVIPKIVPQLSENKVDLRRVRTIEPQVDRVAFPLERHHLFDARSERSARLQRLDASGAKTCVVWPASWALALNLFFVQAEHRLVGCSVVG